MSLYYETRGNGPDVVLLHGWAMNGDVWETSAEQLASHHRVTTIDLPGHGRSATLDGDYSLANLATALADAMPDKAAVIGWSLGGSVALQLALDYPHRVERLVLVSTTPQFIKSSDWPHGVDESMVAQLADNLQTQYRETIQRFLAIQALGSEAAREEIRRLKEQVFAHGDPDPSALQGGLAILQSHNQRARLGEVQCPVQLINGEHDRLMPLAGARAFAESLPDARLGIIEGAGHAPFLSHPDEFHATVEAFL